MTPCRHHLSTPDAVLLDAGQEEAERELRDMDTLLLELVLQVTPLSLAAAVSTAHSRPAGDGDAGVFLPI